MGKIFLVRHGETEWNKNARFQGQTDIPLSPTGKMQAKKVGERLANEKIDAIYSSDLSRAYQTAQEIARYHHIPITRNQDLREINFGQWEGLSRDVILHDHKDLYEQWLEDPIQTRAPEGENFYEVQSRAIQALKTIMENHQDDTVVIVAHGGLIKSVIIQYLEGGFWEFPQGNTAVNILEYKGGSFRFVTLNDLTHLEGED